MSGNAKERDGMSENVTEHANGIRTAIIGDRKSRKEIATALSVCTRTIDNLARKHAIPFVTLFGEHYFRMEYSPPTGGLDPTRRRTSPRQTAEGCGLIVTRH
jgi:hypothetical protein